MARVQQFNRDVRGWTAGTKRKMKLNVVRMTAVYSGHAREDLFTRVRSYMGEASKIQFAFPYYLVFVHKGAGRGHGGFKTGKFTRADGSKGLTRRSSMGKMGTGQRQPRSEERRVGKE